jgi:hypothetical protein
MLFEQTHLAGQRLRLIGVKVEQLVDADLVSEPLWGNDDDSWRAIDKTTDQLREKFGRNAVSPARLIDPKN